VLLIASADEEVMCAHT